MDAGSAGRGDGPGKLNLPDDETVGVLTARGGVRKGRSIPQAGKRRGENTLEMTREDW